MQDRFLAREHVVDSLHRIFISRMLYKGGPIFDHGTGMAKLSASTACRVARRVLLDGFTGGLRHLILAGLQVRVRTHNQHRLVVAATDRRWLNALRMRRRHLSVRDYLLLLLQLLLLYFLLLVLCNILYSVGHSTLLLPLLEGLEFLLLVLH